MRKLAAILAICLAFSISCTKESDPSYVGTWMYESSDPDLGPEYIDSWVTINKKGEYEFFDGGTGSSFSGDFKDFKNDGLAVTLSAHNDSEERVFVATVKRLKDGKMTVETDSVNGVMTLINFRKEE